MPTHGHVRPVGRRPADFVLGDAHGTACAPPWRAWSRPCCRSQGYRVRRNDPYAGGYITRHYGRPREGVHALQIEIARELYMDEGRIERLPGFAAVRHEHDPADRRPGGDSRAALTRPALSSAKKWRRRGTAKFREETSKKADSAVRDRIAAMHNLGDRSFACKRFFALQHRIAQFSSAASDEPATLC